MLIHFAVTPERMASLPGSELDRPVSELCRSHREGYHLIVIDRTTATWILQKATLNRADSAMVSRLHGEATQSLDLINRAQRYIRIVDNARSSFRQVGNAIEMSLSDVKNIDVFGKSLLLVEDSQSDGRLYELLMSSARDLRKFPNISTEIVHGGGDRPSDLLADKIKEKRIICVVDDSDCSWPG